MNVASPDLLTLLDWAQRLAAGDRCPAWEAWCASSPEAAWKWERISQAQDLLASGDPAGEADLSVEDLAAYLDRRLAPLDDLRVEQACWQSSTQLAELLSAARFMRQPPDAPVSQQLESRLLALAPSRPSHANGQPAKYRLAAPTPKLDSAVSEPPPEAAALRVQSAITRRPFLVRWQWPLLAAALLASIAVSGAVGWLAATWQQSHDRQQPIARGPEGESVLPNEALPRRTTNDEPSSPSPGSSLKELSPPSPNDPAAPSVPPVSVEQAPSPAQLPPTHLPDEHKASSQPADDPPPTPKHRPRLAPPTPELAFRSLQGLMLVDPGQRGTWRAAPEHCVLSEPTTLLSLAESWTAVEVSGFGTLILEGVAEVTLTTLPVAGVELHLVRGRAGIQNLQAGAQIRLLTADADCTVRGAVENSLLIVVHDPLSPGVLVQRGEVIVNDVPLAEGLVTRWVQGAPQPPQSLVPPSTATSTAASAMPPAINPWDLAWLNPPDENARKQWRTMYGKMVDRLAAADNVGSELTRLMAQTRDPRQAALLARWTVAAAAASARPEQTWSLLGDRRAPVRAAAVKCLLELPPGDERLAATTNLLKDKLGGSSAQRVTQWLSAAWKPGPPPANEALELVEHLQHQELVMRQVAVSLLELHTASAFQQLGVIPPIYDAGGPPSRRTAAQMEWTAIIQQLYSPTRKIMVPLDPQLQRRLQNAAQGGT